MTGFLVYLAVAVLLVAVWLGVEQHEAERDAEDEHIERTGGK
jgi:hypothetical protein